MRNNKNLFFSKGSSEEIEEKLQQQQQQKTEQDKGREEKRREEKRAQPCVCASVCLVTAHTRVVECWLCRWRQRETKCKVKKTAPKSCHNKYNIKI
jgi:hypothetical protein